MEIIPKPVQRAPQWQIIIFYASAVLLIGLILAYFILGYSYKKSSLTSKDLENAIAGEKTSERIALEKNILLLQKRIGDFINLDSNHLLVSRVFTIIEENCHPRIWFSKFNLNSKTNSFSVSGLTDNFTSLGQQLIIFKNNPIFKNVSLTRVVLDKSGQVNFDLSVFLDPKAFK